MSFQDRLKKLEQGRLDNDPPHATWLAPDVSDEEIRRLRRAGHRIILVRPIILSPEIPAESEVSDG
jgi:hypothetical protein